MGCKNLTKAVVGGDRLREIADRYDDFEVLEADLGTTAGQQATVDRITDGDRPIDLVVNNAGFGTSGVFHTLDAGSPGR